MGELSGKVAIVTGASKGIGAAIARRFSEAGAAVAVNYSSDKAGADRLVDEIVRKGGKAVAIQANVAKSADVKRLFAETKAKLGGAQHPGQQRRRVHLPAARGGDGRRVPPPVRHQRFGDAACDSGGGERLQWRGRQRDQYQHDFEHQPGAEFGRLFGLEGRDRLDHQGAGERTRGPKNPGQRHRARHDRNRRFQRPWASRSRPRKRSACRFRWGGSVSLKTSRGWRFSWPRTSRRG